MTHQGSDILVIDFFLVLVIISFASKLFSYYLVLVIKFFLVIVIISYHANLFSYYLVIVFTNAYVLLKWKLPELCLQYLYSVRLSSK